ncbi:MAG: carbonic anhydrase family protein [Pacificimonas sp.]
MNRIVVALAATSALALAACGESADVETADADMALEDSVSEVEMTPATWSYEGEGGPENWAEISADNATCDTGMRQSPFDLPASAGMGGETPELAINYAEGPLVIAGQGYNTNINATPDSHIMIDGERFDLVQIHMHTPSEYTVAGTQYAADAHYVHANDAGELAVIGLFFEEGAANETLAAAIDNFSTAEAEMEVEGATFNPADILPEDRSFYSFMGSLTTPPCSENVRWMVMETPVTMSAEQVARMTELYGETARPLQEMNDRDIAYSG